MKKSVILMKHYKKGNCKKNSTNTKKEITVTMNTIGVEFLKGVAFIEALVFMESQ